MDKKEIAGRAERAAEIISEAIGRGQSSLSEHASSKLIEMYGAAVADSKLCAGADEAAEYAGSLGTPVVLKLCSPDAPHKKELGFVAVGLSGAEKVLSAAKEMVSRAGGMKIEGLLVQRLVCGERELLVGMKRDRSFGPCVTLGMGGVFTEALKDISVRVAPICAEDAGEMLDELKSAAMFGNYRGLPAVDRAALADTLIGLGEIGLRHPEISEIDVNPLIIGGDGKPVAVDALVILGGGGAA